MSRHMIIETNSESNLLRSPVVDIWLTRPADISNELRHAYRGLLDAVETERLQRFLVHEAHDQFLIGRALLRTVLSNYANVPHEAWSFDKNAYGKPHIAGPGSGRDLKFNLSHAKGLVACAVSRDYELGVDVESLQRDLDYAAFMSKVFAQAEVFALNQMPAPEQRRHFYSLWTLKEAYIKARGMGLALPLNGFWFDLNGPTPLAQFSERCPDTTAHWQFFLFEPTSEHVLALAVAVPPKQRVSVRIHWAVPLSAS